MRGEAAENGKGGGAAAKTAEDDLSTRIGAARAALEPEQGPGLAQKYNTLALAWRMTLELVVGAAFGFALGWGLDELIGTTPWGMIVFGLLGFAAGVKLVIETAREANAAGGAGPRGRARSRDLED